MENLWTIQPQSVHDESMVDLDEFFKESLDLMTKFKCRLSQHVNSTCLEKYTLDKIDKAHVLLDSLCQQWEERRDRVVHLRRKVLQELDVPLTNNEYLSIMHAMRELSKKYYELESLSLSDDVWDNTIDAIMTKMEEVDGKIAHAFERADKMMGRVEEKLYKVAGVATEQIDKLKFAVSYGSQRLLMYDELPGPWQSNEYIRTGYRFLDSAADCWHSLFYLHNETCNIWTHLLGFVGLFSLGMYELFFSERIESFPLKDRIMFGVFILAACKCLMCSTVWHTLSGISDLKTYRQVACLDYVGISVLICASLMLCEYYGFYCDEAVRNVYITATSTMAVIGVSMPFQAWFDKHERRWLRIAFFVTLASSGAIIIAHLALVRGTATTFSWLTPVFKSIACYIAGVVIYGNQFPERFWPGKFDRLGHSHQFWHLFVCGGIWYHYQAALAFGTQRTEFAQCPIAN